MLTAWQQLLSPEELGDDGVKDRVQKLLRQEGSGWHGPAGGNSCSHLKSLRMVEARLASNSFWAWRIWLAQTTWQQLLSPEELEDGSG